jgi:ribosomal protein L29
VSHPDIKQLSLEETEALLDTVKEDQNRDAKCCLTVLDHTVTEDGKYIVTIELEDEKKSKSFIIDGRDSAWERWQPKTTVAIAGLLKLQKNIHQLVSELADLRSERVTPAIKKLAAIRDGLSVSHIPTNELPKPKDCVAIEFDPWSIDYE